MGPGLVHAAGRWPSHVGTSAWMLFKCYPSFKDAERWDINTEPVLAGFSTYSVTFSRPSSGDAEDELFHVLFILFFSFKAAFISEVVFIRSGPITFLIARRAK